MLKNYGLKIDEIKAEDYIFGSSPLPFEILEESGDWTNSLPSKEAQNLNGIEPYACVAFTVLNCIEILIKRKYVEEVNYSDRFLAAVSGTKEGGNSAQIVCEFLRKVGVVPEELWPFGKDIDTFDKFYSPIPPKLYELAKEFNEKWEFKHEFVPSDNKKIKEALKCSPLAISVVAWFENGGVYFQPTGLKDNHLTMLFKIDKYKTVFDSYDPFIKNYELNTTHLVIKRFWIKKKIQEKKQSWLARFLSKITWEG